MHTDDIYAALQDDDAFQKLPDILARAGGGRSCMLFWVHRDGEVQSLAYNHYTPEFMATHASWAHKDVWIAAATSPAAMNRLCDAGDYVPDRTFERTEIYNEFVRAQGDDTYRCIGGAFTTPFGSMTIGVQRGRGQPAYDERNIAKLARLVPHVRRVISVRGEILAHSRERNIGKAMLDAVGLAAITVARSGRILSVNQGGEVVLRRGDGLAQRRGLLVCPQPAGASLLAEAIAGAIGPDAGARALMLNRGPGLEPYQVTVTPLAGTATALVLLRDPDLRDVTLVQRLRGLFGLTAAEAELAIALSQGASLDDIAAQRAVRQSTLRTQLKAVAAKMRCNRQAEIAAIVARLPPLQPPGD